MFDYSKSILVIDVDPLERDTDYAVAFNAENGSVTIEYSIEGNLHQRICFRNIEIAKQVYRALGNILEG